MQMVVGYCNCTRKSGTFRGYVCVCVSRWRYIVVMDSEITHAHTNIYSHSYLLIVIIAPRGGVWPT